MRYLVPYLLLVGGLLWYELDGRFRTLQAEVVDHRKSAVILVITVERQNQRLDQVLTKLERIQD